MLSFAIIDVFNQSPYLGNPLAVVEDNESNLSKTQMQLIARQFNLSETTFVCSPSSGAEPIYLRSFLPNGREVFGSGHNILGVWLYLAISGRLDLSDVSSTVVDQDQSWNFRQRIGEEVSPIIVSRRADGSIVVVLRQSRPQLHEYHPNLETLAEDVGLRSTDFGLGSRPDLQPQVASTSTTRHLLVPVKSTEVLERVTIDRDKLAAQLAQAGDGVFGIYFFTNLNSPSVEDGYEARFFSPGMNGEDPATGSAAGPLSAYLYRHKALVPKAEKATVRVWQGRFVGRGCMIDVRLSVGSEGTDGDQTVDVDLVGGGALVANGYIQAPDSSIAF